MPVLPDDYELEEGIQRKDPLIWVQDTPPEIHRLLAGIDVSDAALATYLGDGKSRKLKSFGHDDDGVHFLLTSRGTPVHTDPVYARYTHQLVLRNDGNRLRGLPKYDKPQNEWHMPLVPGTLYCLDTHSPHQGLGDPRISRDGQPGMKAVLAVDRRKKLDPDKVLALLMPWLERQAQMSELEYDEASYTQAPRYKG